MAIPVYFEALFNRRVEGSDVLDACYSTISSTSLYYEPYNTMTVPAIFPGSLLLLRDVYLALRSCASGSPGLELWT